MTVINSARAVCRAGIRRYYRYGKGGRIVSIFNYLRLDYGRARRKSWWEMSAEFPPDEPFYDPADFDPLGSYTGLPKGGGKPEQDADDL